MRWRSKVNHDISSKESIVVDMFPALLSSTISSTSRSKPGKMLFSVCSRVSLIRRESRSEKRTYVNTR